MNAKDMSVVEVGHGMGTDWKNGNCTAFDLWTCAAAHIGVMFCLHDRVIDCVRGMIA